MSGVTLGTIALATAAGALVVGTGYSIYAGEQQKSAQKDAMNKQAQYNSEQLAQAEKGLQAQKQAQAAAMASAKRQEKLAEEQLNASMRKTPDTGALLASAENASKTGVGGTMLTGPSGVDPSSLSLEKKTLLGA